MIKKCIKVPFVEEVTGKPGAQVLFVEQSTSSLDTTVQAAVDGLYCLGNAQLVKNTFLGLFRSMLAGVMRDGKPRKIADFIRAYPVFTGAVDLDKGFDPKENGVYLAVELLNEMKLDISSWSFEDVTEGRKAITIESVKGIDFGVVDPTKSVEINGRGLSGSHKVELQLEGGEVIAVDPEYVSGDIARMDIAAAAFEQFADKENDGKALTITVRGNFAKQSKTVTLLMEGPAPFTLKKVTSTATGRENEAKLFIDDLIIDGSGYDASTTATVHMDMPNGKSLEIDMIDGNTLTLLSPNSLKLHLAENTSTEPDGTWKMGYPTCVVVRKGDGTELTKAITVV